MKECELRYEIEKCHALLGHVEPTAIALLKRAEKAEADLSIAQNNALKAIDQWQVEVKKSVLAEAEVARLQAQIESMRKEK